MNEALVIIAKLVSDNFWTLYITINFWIILTFLISLALIDAIKVYAENKK